MVKIVYEIVKHDGGWAYRVDGAFSEPFPTHDAARAAAMHAAQRQEEPGDTVGIEFEDRNGHWHRDLSRGDDRPETEVTGQRKEREQ